MLDFGHTIMGPCAGVVFADLGADVIKVEPVDGDPTRRLPGFAAGFFATYNRNKRSIAVDLKSRPTAKPSCIGSYGTPMSSLKFGPRGTTNVSSAVGTTCARSIRVSSICP